MPTGDGRIQEEQPLRSVDDDCVLKEQPLGQKMTVEYQRNNLYIRI